MLASFLILLAFGVFRIHFQYPQPSSDDAVCELKMQIVSENDFKDDYDVDDVDDEDDAAAADDDEDNYDDHDDDHDDDDDDDDDGIKGKKQQHILREINCQAAN